MDRKETRELDLLGNMKFVYLMFFLCVCLCSYGQSYKDVYIKGIYLSSFKKGEIIEMYENEKKRVSGQNHSIAIDFSSVSFFIPLQIEKKRINYDNIPNEESVFLSSCNDSLFIIPSYKDIDFLIERNLLTYKTMDECCILSNAMKFSPYYVIDSNNDKLFRSVYIEGYFRCYDIHNIEEKWQSYLLDVYTKSTKVKNQTLFVLEKIRTYTPYIEDERFKKWLPYLK